MAFALTTAHAKGRKNKYTIIASGKYQEIHSSRTWFTAGGAVGLSQTGFGFSATFRPI
jgi:hypothetical protein